MKLSWLLYLGFFLTFPKNIYSQEPCNKDKLLGTWMRANIYLHSKDTLTKENLTILLNDSVKNKTNGWVFDNSGKHTSFPDEKIEIYRVDEKGCKIIYGERKNPSRYQIIRILYLDEKFLVVQIPNRHSHTTASFIKK